jgi:hypothetical protein
MPPIGRTVVGLAVLAAACLALTSCSDGARSAGPTSSGTAGSPGAATTGAAFDPTSTPTSSAAAAAAWAAVAPSWPSYQLDVTREGFAGTAGEVRATTKVDHGQATTQAQPPDGDPTASPSALPTGFPRTVEDLLRVAAGPDVTRVVYDPTGVPLEIDVDPVPNAVDDEFTYSVSLSVPSQHLLLPSVDRAPSPSATPTARYPATPSATLSGDGRSLTMVTWGGSNCWPVPAAARAVSATALLVETLDFPPGGCTLDFRAHVGTVAVTIPTAARTTEVIVHSFYGTAAAPSIGLSTVTLRTS